MPNPDLPVELLDHIVDLLHDTDYELKSCCLVSKSWIPRTRRHLFAHVLFRDAKDLQSWKTTFPDPFTSPAYYTRNLSIRFCPVAVAAGGEEGGWIQTFSRAVRFEIGTLSEPATFLLPFHRFSPALKSLHLMFTALPSALVFDFVSSFPLLEDLSVFTRDSVSLGGGVDGKLTIAQSSSPPPFTGTLRLCLKMGMNPIASRLLSLQKGLHFKKLDLVWFSREDSMSGAALVERCSPTLQFLLIGVGITSDLSPHVVNLSKATKLVNVAFLFPYNPRCAAATLRTITLNHKNLQGIWLSYENLHLRSSSINPARFRVLIGNAAYQEWLDLDRCLTRLRESCSVHLKVMYGGSTSTALKPKARSCMESLLPESTARGIVDLIDFSVMD